MMQHEYTTGHGDTIEDLLDELEWQIKEQWERAALVERFKIKQKYPFLFTADEFKIISNAAIAEGAATEREACAKLMDNMDKKDNLSNYYKVAANVIRARGNNDV